MATNFSILSDQVCDTQMWLNESLGNEAISECCQEGTEYIDRNFHFRNLL